MTPLRLALISGGTSSEREVSINSGNQVYDALDKEKYLITRYDPKTDLPLLIADAPNIDAALIILHGCPGEDGTIQGLLDLLDIPYQGAGVLGSSIAMNKLAAKKLYQEAGIPTPAYLHLTKQAQVHEQEIIQTLGLPLVIKPVSAGSSVGMSLVRKKKQLLPAIEKAFFHNDAILAEAYIQGTELTCGVLGNENISALPIIEIIPGTDHEFFDYTAKYQAEAAQEICPARVDEAVTQKVQQLSVMAHETLMLRGYSRTDFILQNDQIFALETNTIPGMTANSLFPKSAAAAGYEFSQLLDILIQLSLENHKRTRQRRESI